MSDCERHKFIDIDDRIFCEHCGDAPTPEQLEKILAARECPTLGEEV